MSKYIVKLEMSTKNKMVDTHWKEKGLPSPRGCGYSDTSWLCEANVQVMDPPWSCVCVGVGRGGASTYVALIPGNSLTLGPKGPKGCSRH